MTISKQLKLVPQLVPKPLWGKSAAQIFGRHSLWTQIRSDTLVAANHTCEACLAKGIPLDCHEVWHYDDEHGVATLAALKIHCEYCHMAVHIGRAAQHGNRDAAIAQLCKVNGITPEEAEKLRKNAMAVWSERSKKKWRIAVEQHLLERYPQLAALSVND